MDLTNQVATLQDEVKLLKGEIKAILKEIRTAVLSQDNPFAAGPGVSGLTGDRPSVPAPKLRQEEPPPPDPMPLTVPAFGAAGGQPAAAPTVLDTGPIPTPPWVGSPSVAQAAPWPAPAPMATQAAAPVPQAAPWPAPVPMATQAAAPVPQAAPWPAPVPMAAQAAGPAPQAAPGPSPAPPVAQPAAAPAAAQPPASTALPPAVQGPPRSAASAPALADAFADEQSASRRFRSENEPIPIRPDVGDEEGEQRGSDTAGEKRAWSLPTIAGLAVWAEDAIAALGPRRFRFVLDLAAFADLLTVEERGVLTGLATDDTPADQDDRPLNVNECLVVLRQLDAVVHGERLMKLPRRRGIRHRRVR